jgi:hypothetical protein
MDGSFADVWPEGQPTSLWNYDLLRPGDVRLLPMMGLRPEWPFLLAFLFGVALIAFFAWRRFRTRTFDPDALDARVIKELLPDQLRGKGPMRRAYAAYVAMMLVVYTALVFFGGLILRTVNSFDMVGLQVELNDTYLASPQWPVFLAFGIAGFTELIPPVRVVESWFRQKAHEFVGIPTRIKEHTRALLKNLEAAVATDAAAAPIPAWARAYIAESDSLERVLRTRERLELLMRLLREEDGWPRVEVRDDLRRLEAEEMNEAELALQDFEDALHARSRDPRKREARLRHAIDTMKRLETDLGATLSVYGERDRAFARIADPGLRAVMERTFPPEEATRGPDRALGISLFLVFLAYFVLVAAGQHSLLTTTDRVLRTVFATAALETARVAALFWAPVLAVFFWRSRAERWQPIRLAPPSVGAVEQALRVLGLATAVSLVGLGLVAVVQAALIAPNQLRFQEILLTGQSPILGYYLWQAGAGGINALLVALAVDDSADPPTLPAWAYGALNLLLVSGWMVGHLALRSGLSLCPAGGWACYRWYGVTDFLVYAALAWLGATAFARLQRRRPREWASPSPAATAVVLVAGALAAAGPSRAQGTPAAEEDPTVVVAGFRNDVEPFSFRSRNPFERRFDGYIADLCYDIFEGSHYRLVPVAVSAQDRFGRLRTRETAPHDPAMPEDAQPIDILCDPVTLRFSQPEDRAKNGIFSPIVFASGVSYMLRTTRVPRSHAYLVYVGNTTTVPVAELACEVDLLGIRGGDPAVGCAAPAGSPGDCPPAGDPPTGASAYHFCVVDSHSAAIEIFCQVPKGNDLPYAIAYFGDREIILGKLNAWRDQGRWCPQNIEKDQPYYTYEPYALLVTKARPALVQYVQRRVYEIFSHRSEALSHFTEHFPGVRMSPVLADLFLLNAVDEEKYYRSSDAD